MWDFRTFGTLPEPGALWDQPAGLLARMRHAEVVYNVITGFNRAPKLSVWAEQNPDASRMKNYVDKLRAIDAG